MPLIVVRLNAYAAGAKTVAFDRTVAEWGELICRCDVETAIGVEIRNDGVAAAGAGGELDFGKEYTRTARVDQAAH